MPESPTVFISYPRDADKAQTLAKELYELLCKEGVPVFMDEFSIKLGDRWIRKLSDSVESCKVLLAIISPSSHDRPWVEKEYIAASEANSLIIPVLSSSGKLPIQVNDLQAAKLYGKYKNKEITKLVTRIKEEISDSINKEVPKFRISGYRIFLYLFNLLSWLTLTLANTVMAVEYYTLLGTKAVVLTLLSSAFFAFLVTLFIVLPFTIVICLAHWKTSCFISSRKK